MNDRIVNFLRPTMRGTLGGTHIVRWWTAGRITSVRHIRLHGARHSCGTLMHLENVPIAVISVLLGHASKAFTMATYVHSQPDVLAAAAQSFARVVDRRS
ncbi:tyrosine-type recombinase/integrase [Mycolicibacterium austroafricanum]|uniref:tyrosine-type recombinase/integrase n=1 Tax=Mycolicibacterium austroafricanum TaxID=39687 RepID=UPI003AF337D4